MECHIVILPAIGVPLAVLISQRLGARTVQSLLIKPPSLRDIVDMMALSRAVIKYVPAIRQHILDEIHDYIITLLLYRPAQTLVNIWCSGFHVIISISVCLDSSLSQTTSCCLHSSESAP